MSLFMRRLALTHWMWGQIMSEGFAALFLDKNRYTEIVPQAPLGGPDGGRDIAFRDGNRFGVAACYFPPTPHPFKDIAAKFASDFEKAQRFQPQIFVFITGQELTPMEEESLRRHSNICEIRVLDVHALSIHLVPIFQSLGIDVSEFRGADTSIKLLREVIASSYFWNLPNGWENAIHSFGREVMSIEGLEEVIATVDYDLSDRHLDELLAIFVQAWRNLLCKLIMEFKVY